MKKHDIVWATILTYSGTVPFILCACAHYMLVHGFDHAMVARAYGAIIAAFLCGIHWAIYLFFASRCPRNLLLTSNAVALLAWGSLLLAPPTFAMLLQALCFLYLLTLDLKLRDAGILPVWFYHLRRNATMIVVLCLALIR